MDAYAEAHIWTDELRATVNSAADAGVVGAADLRDAIEDGSFSAFDEAYGTYADALSEAGYDITPVVDEALEAEDVPDTAEYGVWVPGIPVLIGDGHGSHRLRGLAGKPAAGRHRRRRGRGARLHPADAGAFPAAGVFGSLRLYGSVSPSCWTACSAGSVCRASRLSRCSSAPAAASRASWPRARLKMRRDRPNDDHHDDLYSVRRQAADHRAYRGGAFDGAWWVAPGLFRRHRGDHPLGHYAAQNTDVLGRPRAVRYGSCPRITGPRSAICSAACGERASSFIKAGTIILLASIVIWAGSVFRRHRRLVRL